MSTLELPELRAGPRGLPYHLLLPRVRPTGMLVLVHGQSRGALRLASGFAAAAATAGVALVAPRFQAPDFAGYPRLRGEGRMLGSAEALNEACRDAAGRAGLVDGPRSLVGFSAGAQFVHRHAMAFPALVERLVVASAGWYTLPDPSLAYPLGVAPSLELPGGLPHLKEFLGLPIRVLVGAQDVRRDAMLRVSPFLDARQGEHRLARALHWVAAVRAAAREHGVTPRVALELLPHTAHSVRQAIRHGGFVERTMAFVLSRES